MQGPPAGFDVREVLLLVEWVLLHNIKLWSGFLYIKSNSPFRWRCEKPDWLTVRVAGLEVGHADGAVLALHPAVQSVRLDQVGQLHQLLGLGVMHILSTLAASKVVDVESSTNLSREGAATFSKYDATKERVERPNLAKGIEELKEERECVEKLANQYGCQTTAYGA
jgi:hypothetical protein